MKPSEDVNEIQLKETNRIIKQTFSLINENQKVENTQNHQGDDSFRKMKTSFEDKFKEQKYLVKYKRKPISYSNKQGISQLFKTSYLNIGYLDLNEIFDRIENWDEFCMCEIIEVDKSYGQTFNKRLKKGEKGEKFIDKQFPHQPASFSSQKKFRSLIWKTMPEYQLVDGKADQAEVMQGGIADCYLLAGIAALAQIPYRIHKLFYPTKKNPSDYYSVRILFRGKWKIIEIDSYLPFIENKLFCSFSKNRLELWVALLQKAWAKLYKNYKGIQRGTAQQSLHDLTGAPIQSINLSNYKINDIGKLWKKLLEYTKKQYAMVTTIKKPPQEKEKDYDAEGLIYDHAYTLISAYQLHFQGTQLRLVCLRNPHANKKQWAGDWHNGDERWARINEADEQMMKINDNWSDGKFFIPYEKFLQKFSSITIAKINDHASYVSKSFLDKYKLGVAYFRIDIYRKGFYSFQLNKTPKRCFAPNSNYDFPKGKLIIKKIDEQPIRQIKQCESKSRTLYLNQNIQPGTYVAQARIYFNHKLQKQHQINLAIYGQYCPFIQIVTQQELNKFGKKYWYGTEPQQKYLPRIEPKLRAVPSISSIQQQMAFCSPRKEKRKVKKKTTKTYNSQIVKEIEIKGRKEIKKIQKLEIWKSDKELRYNDGRIVRRQTEKAEKQNKEYEDGRLIFSKKTTERDNQKKKTEKKERSLEKMQNDIENPQEEQMEENPSLLLKKIKSSDEFRKNNIIIQDMSEEEN